MDFIESCAGNQFRYLVCIHCWKVVSQAYKSSADKIIVWFTTHLFSSNESLSRFDFILTQNIVNHILNQFHEQGVDDPILLKPIQYSMIQWSERLKSNEKNNLDNSSPLLEPLPLNVPKTILLEPIIQKNLYLLNQLLNYILIDVNLQNPNRSTALTIAASLGNRAACERLLKVPGINPNITSNANRSAIWEGCYRGRGRNLDENYLEITKSILAHPDTLVNHQDFLGMTVLHLACYNGLVLHVEALLKHPDIDLTILDKIGETALHKSIYHSPFDSGSSGCEMGPVIRDMEIPQVLTARALLTKEPNLLNMKNLEGSTFLHTCVKNAEDELVAELLKYPEINVNERDIDGKTALHYACQFNMFHCAKYLYNHPDIEKEILDNQGNPPWFYIDNQSKEMNTSWFFKIDKTELKTLFAVELKKTRMRLTADPIEEAEWASPLTYCGIFRSPSEPAPEKTERATRNLRHST